MRKGLFLNHVKYMESLYIEKGKGQARANFRLARNCGFHKFQSSFVHFGLEEIRLMKLQNCFPVKLRTKCSNLN